MPAPESELVLIFDFGSQFGQLIARRVREQNVFCQVVRHDLTAARVKRAEPEGRHPVRRPGERVRGRCAPLRSRRSSTSAFPVLGICYGMQLACQALGGTVGGGAHTREYGRATLSVNDRTTIFAGYPAESTVWMSHGDQVQNVSGEFEALAFTDACPLAAIKHKSRPIFGLQFHPEVAHTPHGGQILANFLRDVCGCSGLWKMTAFIDNTVRDIIERRWGTSGSSAG